MRGGQTEEAPDDGEGGGGEGGEAEEEHGGAILPQEARALVPSEAAPLHRALERAPPDGPGSGAEDQGGAPEGEEARRREGEGGRSGARRAGEPRGERAE